MHVHAHGIEDESKCHCAPLRSCQIGVKRDFATAPKTTTARRSPWPRNPKIRESGAHLVGCPECHYYGL
jgi:hypothetical protein